MTTVLIKLAAFVSAAVLGIAAVQPWLRIVSTAEQYEPTAVAAVPVEPIQAVSLFSDDPALYDPNVDYTKVLKVKLLQTGEYHADEVPYKSGETWLGLIRCGDGSYELRRTKVFIESLNYDGLYDRAVTTSNRCESVFLLRGATDLPLGDVETQFDRNAPGSVVTNKGIFLNDEFAYFNGSEPKGFDNGFGMFWWVWIENPSPEGFPQKDSSLVLNWSGGNPQVLRTLPDGCNDCGWSIEWVGDLDRDRQLDFLINVSGHYNSYEPTLFLSSKGYSVFASFWSVGC